MTDYTEPNTPDEQQKEPTADKSWLEMENVRSGDDPFPGGNDGATGSDE